jgi:hypothetical protein
LPSTATLTSTSPKPTGSFNIAATEFVFKKVKVGSQEAPAPAQNIAPAPAKTEIVAPVPVDDPLTKRLKEKNYSDEEVKLIKELLEKLKRPENAG